MAVKRLRSTVDEREQKQLLMDLEVVMKSNDCPYIVRFYGALFKEVPNLRLVQDHFFHYFNFYKFYVYSLFIFPGRVLDMHGANGHVTR